MSLDSLEIDIDANSLTFDSLTRMHSELSDLETPLANRAQLENQETPLQSLNGANVLRRRYKDRPTRTKACG